MDANLKEEWSNRDTLGPYGEQSNTKPPFNVYIYPNLLEDQYVGQLRDDINSSIKLKPKDNDLYKFKQSKDFKTEIPAKKLTPLLHDFIDLMLGKVREHLEKVTGLQLSIKNFDITASRYDVGNYLLCHNDDMKDNLKQHGRALAFIYYLNSRQWLREDGGALILYESDKSGEPIKINNSILPKPNTLIAFETSSTSWHSVEEVYCKDDFRLSINGWFHTDRPSKVNYEADRIIEPCPYTFLKPVVVDERVEKFFNESFNQEYMMGRTCYLIRKRFKKKSEINLTHFLVKEKFDEISAALKEATSKEENLVHVGPYNKRNYRRLKLDKLPPVCKDLYDAFQSELFFMLLSRLTGLDLQPPSIKTDEDGASNEDENDDDDEDDDDDDDDEDDDDDDDDDDEDEDEDSDEEDDESSEEEEEADDEEEDDNDDEEDKEVDAEKREIPSSIQSTNDKVGGKPKTITAGEPSRKQTEEPTTSKEKFGGDTLTKKSVDLPRKRKKTADPLARMEFRQLDTGAYTLIHDHGFELGEKSALDVILHFNHDFAVNFEDGGYISYIDGAPDDDLHDMNYELLTVEPKSNCLSLVYRCDEGTCRFLKHISKSHKSNYQDLYCVYYERPDDLPKM